MKKRFYIPAVSLVLCLALTLGLMLPAGADNSSPIAENAEFETYRGVSFGGKLNALDPDGDALTFEITTTPKKGNIELNADGSFVYTPRENKRGRDYFGFKVTDSEGNRSQEATVIIRLIKCETAIKYADMQRDPAEYAAVMLADKGLFVGKMLAGSYYFEPEHTVSRGEFLSLCLELCDTDILSGVVSTGFSDDADIADVLKPYVATAVLNGVITCGFADDGKSFAAAEPVSYAEAMLILDKCLGLNDVSYIDVDNSVPEGSVQSAANLSACGIISDTSAGDAPLSRAKCADMLANAMSVLNRR